MLQHFINGERVSSINGNSFTLKQASRWNNPVEVVRGDSEDVDLAVKAAESAVSKWRRKLPRERAEVLQNVAAKLRENIEVFTKEECADTGKPETLARAEVLGSAEYFDFYASLVNLPIGDVLDVKPDLHVYTIREPYGVIGIITPWNLPLNQAARACAPALVAGNTVVLKPAEVTPTTSIMLAELMIEAGAPKGLFNVVLGQGSVVGNAIVEHPGISKLAFTGSVPVGQQIGAIAAKRVLPLTLELGGKSACIVFPDSNLELAAKEAIRAFTTNSGQVCSSGTRLLVHEDVEQELLEIIEKRVQQLQTGVDYGPMITDQQNSTVKEYLSIAESEGAIPVTGGSTSEADGNFIQPTVYRNVKNTMRIAQEEIFGPVLSVITFKDKDEAIAMANDSEFGLAGGVFSNDIALAMEVAAALKVGQVYINSWSTQSVEMPFGGNKMSGYGREKGIEAIHHYSQVKSVSINLGAVS